MTRSETSRTRLWLAGLVGFVVGFIATSVIYYLILGDPQPILALIVAACGSIGAIVALSIADHRKRANGESS